ncbi:AAA family ATPase [Streptomyces sp. NPDC002734]|uniref:AAA family ATPase n=1 Tax=Streptomyces sp. NPDC002734 TaxID=3154426 RepID=UPI00331E6521
MTTTDPSASLPLPDLVGTRLAGDAKLTEPVKDLVRQALGDSDSTDASATPAGPVYLGKVKVTGFRGIGSKAELHLRPGPGVTLVVGPNGAGKSSLAEGIETLFTGTNASWAQGKDRVAKWRNLHNDERSSVEAQLVVGDDRSRSTLTRTWAGETFADSETVFKRPGNDPVPLEQVGWDAAMRNYRPFLSYVDLGKMINGRPMEMYDNVAAILGLEYLNEASQRLSAMKKEIDAVETAEKAKRPLLERALNAVGDDDRALKALIAMDEKGGGPDYATLDALIAGVSTADEGRLSEARREAEAEALAPALDEVTARLDALQRAVDDVEALKGTAAETANTRAELLTAALRFSERHADDVTCPVCESERILDRTWATRVEREIAAALQDAAAVRKADSDRRVALAALHDMMMVPPQVPVALTEPWLVWSDCRSVSDPAELIPRARQAAVTLADASEAVARKAREALAAMDERWRRVVDLLAEWVKLSREVQAAKPRKTQVNAALKWIKAHTSEVRDSRVDAFGDRAQHIWGMLRRQSSVGIKKLGLHGTEKANIRKLIMDVTVDGTEAPALSVMSQGELHSLALSLFLPRVATADSPFGFVVIDDPVQSMDLAKVDGLAQVLDELGRERQVVVFTHDTRLPHAFRSQGLPVTVLKVARGERSKVKVGTETDPVKEAIDDAMALAQTKDCPAEVHRNVVPSLCRDALERAVIEAAWARRQRSGRSAESLQAAIDETDRLIPLASFALFDDGVVHSDAEVMEQLRLHGPKSPNLVSMCQKGAHPGGVLLDDAVEFVRDVEKLVESLRKSGGRA